MSTPYRGFAHGPECVRRVPVRLGQDGHAVALALQQAGDEGRAEAGVVDVAVRRHHQEVVVVPAPVDHFLPADGEELHAFGHTVLPLHRI